jgi:hypothetical protein
VSGTVRVVVRPEVDQEALDAAVAEVRTKVREAVVTAVCEAVVPALREAFLSALREAATMAAAEAAKP